MRTLNPLHIIDPALLQWINGGRVGVQKGTDPALLQAMQKMMQMGIAASQQKSQQSQGMMQQMMQGMMEKKSGGAGGGKAK